MDNTVQKKFEVIKVDSQTKQPLAGVQFKIWRDATLLGDYTTDENGKITIEKGSGRHLQSTGNCYFKGIYPER